MGNNVRGAVGDGTYASIPQPYEISSKTILGAKQYTKVACGAVSTFVYIPGQSDVYGWVTCFIYCNNKGRNDDGLLGAGSGIQVSYSPILVKQSPGVLQGKLIRQVDVYSTHALALTTDGLVYSWGNNAYGTY
jgi:alpha-tubulin suppressor-like RCC1 family protein